jgi:hypothetical protein
VENENGVTVLDLVKGLCNFFGLPVDEFANAVIAHDQEVYDDLDSEDMVFTYSDGMGDHRVWNGWDELVVDETGHLLLRAIYFDS